MSSKEFVKYIEEVLEQFGPIKTKSMFGGYGLYKSDLIFAIIVDSELYFKADANSKEYFKAAGSKPFTYNSNGKTVSMSYYLVLPEILEDEASLEKWFDIAYKAAIKSKTSKK